MELKLKLKTSEELEKARKSLRFHAYGMNIFESIKFSV